jgi:hypothetical protein
MPLLTKAFLVVLLVLVAAIPIWSVLSYLGGLLPVE